MGSTAGRAQQQRAKSRQEFLERARRRRLEVDRQRQEREERIDRAVAEVYAALATREEAQQMIVDADHAAAAALRAILGEGESIGRAAELTGLSVNHLQRLKHLDDPGAEPNAPQGRASSRPGPSAGEVSSAATVGADREAGAAIGSGTAGDRVQRSPGP